MRPLPYFALIVFLGVQLDLTLKLFAVATHVAEFNSEPYSALAFIALLAWLLLTAFFVRVGSYAGVLGTGLLVAGNIGNAILFPGNVPDYIPIGLMVYNAADLMAYAGMAIMVLALAWLLVRTTVGLIRA